MGKPLVGILLHESFDSEMFQDQSLGFLGKTSLFTHSISHSQQLIYYNQFN